MRGPPGAAFPNLKRLFAWGGLPIVLGLSACSTVAAFATRDFTPAASTAVEPISTKLVTTYRTVDDATIGDQAYNFMYVGRWEHVAGRRDGRSLGTSSRSFHPHDKAVISFVGTGIRLFGVRGPKGGLALLDVDGFASPQKPDFYAPRLAANALVYSSPPLPDGPHVLTVTVAGARGRESLGTYVNVDDAVVVTQASIPVKRRETGDW